MFYNEKKMNDILGYKTWSDKRKIDELLHMDCSIYANIGIESTQREKQDARSNPKKIYTSIKKIDPVMGGEFLRLMDTK
jgi:hypothetical protein